MLRVLHAAKSGGVGGMPRYLSRGLQDMINQLEPLLHAKTTALLPPDTQTPASTDAWRHFQPIIPLKKLYNADMIQYEVLLGHKDGQRILIKFGCMGTIHNPEM